MTFQPTFCRSIHCCSSRASLRSNLACQNSVLFFGSSSRTSGSGARSSRGRRWRVFCRRSLCPGGRGCVCGGVDSLLGRRARGLCGVGPRVWSFSPDSRSSPARRCHFLERVNVCRGSTLRRFYQDHEPDRYRVAQGRGRWDEWD